MTQEQISKESCPFESVEEFENFAKKSLTSAAYQYFAGFADLGITFKENAEAFKRIKVLPRYLKGFNSFDIDLSTTILGKSIDFPICASPTGFHKLADPEGELATARACSHMNTCMVASSASTMSFQRIAEASSNGIKWLQFDPIKDKQLMIPFLEEAKSGNYSALVITLDTGSGIMKAADIDPMIDFRNRAPLPENVTLPNVGIVVSASEERVTNPEVWFYEIQDGSPNWRELVQWIRSICNLPIVLKGIMSVEDAIMATNLNVDGILVSNHGGRSIDGVPATIEVLLKIVEAINGRLEVYLDGGVRSGSDVFKALALGARAVFLGRPIIWGLAYNGQEGIEAVFKLLRDQLKFVMEITGCSKLSDINKSLVVPQHKLASHL